MRTSDIFNSLTFGGVNSADYGIYITGEAVYNAPERAVEMVSIAGRNGDIAIDQGHWNNIVVEYPAGTFDTTQAGFRKAVSDFRNAVASQLGYQRLSDTYHPDEYRMAMYVSGLEVEPKHYGSAGEFVLKFNCKPQRWLTDGEIPVTIGEWGETETASGDIVTIENEDGVLAVKSLEVALEPIQSGSGTPSPDNVKPISGWTEVETVVSPTTDAEDGTTYTTNLGRTVYGGTLDVVSGELVVDRAMVTLDGTQNISIVNWRPTSSGVGWVYPYSLTNNKIERSDANMPKLVSDSLPTITYGTAYQGTSVGVTTLATTGTTSSYGLVVRTADTSLTTASAINAYLSSNPITVCYELATPQTYQLTAQQIELLIGTNNIWSDGDVTVEYGQEPDVLYNPTPYDASPLLAVEGYGAIGFNGYEVEIDRIELGEIEVLPSETSSSQQMRTEYTTTSLNAGDTMSMSSVSFSYILNFSSGVHGAFSSVNGISIRAIVAGETPSSYTAVLLNSNQIRFTATYNNVSFVYAPDTSTYVFSTSFDISVTATDSTAGHIYPTASMQNTISRVISLFCSNTGSDIFATTMSDFLIQRSALKGISSVSVDTGTKYIDCDLGDAYAINDGSYVSLNSYIDLGSDLPTLASGANEITYDDTITELTITPRYWIL